MCTLAAIRYYAAMNTWIALLRGINVGGHNKVPMAELRGALSGAGFTDVATYIQSGNVVLSADMSAAEVQAAVKALILDTFGHDIRVMAISPEALIKAMDENPFTDRFEKPNWMFMFFLDGIPDAPDMDAMSALCSANEHIALAKDVFYFYAGDGAGRSKVMSKAERLLGVSGTARNWNTAVKLRTMIGE